MRAASKRSALARGRAFLKRDSEITAKQLAGVSESEQAAVRMGVARGMCDHVMGMPEGANAVRRLLKVPKVREQIDAVFPSAAERNAFTQALEREATFNETRGVILGGSRTTPMLKEMGDAGLTDALPIVTDAVRAGRGSVEAMLGLGGRAVGALANRYRAGANERVRNQLGGMLFTQDSAAQRRILNDLLMRAKLDEITRRQRLGAMGGATSRW